VAIAVDTTGAQRRDALCSDAASVIGEQRSAVHRGRRRDEVRPWTRLLRLDADQTTQEGETPDGGSTGAKSEVPRRHPPRLITTRLRCVAQTIRPDVGRFKVQNRSGVLGRPERRPSTSPASDRPPSALHPVVWPPSLRWAMRLRERLGTAATTAIVRPPSVAAEGFYWPSSIQRRTRAAGRQTRHERPCRLSS
jgi:hypothetical protein